MGLKIVLSETRGTYLIIPTRRFLPARAGQTILRNDKKLLKILIG